MKKVFKKLVMSAAAAVVVAGTMTGCNSCPLTCNKVEKMDNKDFYTNGKIDGAKVKQAYFDMMNRFNYPIPDVLNTDNFWTCDFKQENILALGMGGVFWINEKGEYKKAGAKAYKGDYKGQYGYLLHEIYMLPGQTLPEHRHIGGSEEFGPKMESWQVRYGSAYFYGQYKHGDEVLISEVPKDEQPWGYGEKWFKSTYISKRDAKTNQMYTLNDPESWHGLMAGKDGAIITEVATYHNHVEFSKPGLVFANTGDK